MFGHTRGGLDSVDDASEICVLEVEELDGRGCNGDATVESVVGHIVGSNVLARLRQYGIDTGNARFKDVEEYPFKTVVGATGIEL